VPCPLSRSMRPQFRSTVQRLNRLFTHPAAENALLWMTILMDANFLVRGGRAGSPSGQK
jgi:hypothetical protein